MSLDCPRCGEPLQLHRVSKGSRWIGNRSVMVGVCQTEDCPAISVGVVYVRFKDQERKEKGVGEWRILENTLVQDAVMVKQLKNVRLGS